MKEIINFIRKLILISASIKKWEKFKAEVENEVVQDYHSAYWDECGFCTIYGTVHGGCKDCPLHSLEEKENIPYCAGSFSVVSIASMAVKHADKGFFTLASKNADMLMKKMIEIKPT